jgi:hypothetical protein
MPVGNDLAHLPEEEREQERADVRSIDVSISHDDDAMVTQFCRVKALACSGT